MRPYYLMHHLCRVNNTENGEHLRCTRSAVMLSIYQTLEQLHLHFFTLPCREGNFHRWCLCEQPTGPSKQSGSSCRTRRHVLALLICEVLFQVVSWSSSTPGRGRLPGSVEPLESD